MSSSGEKKTASQTDGKAAQTKKSEMGMMSYRVKLLRKKIVWIHAWPRLRFDLSCFLFC